MSWRKYPLNRKRWQAVRLRVLDRDGWRCQGILPNGEKCGRAGRLEVDHRKPLALQGSKYGMANLQSLCRGCHIRKTRAENISASSKPENERWRVLIEERLADVI